MDEIFANNLGHMINLPQIYIDGLHNCMQISHLVAILNSIFSGFLQAWVNVADKTRLSSV